MKTESIISRESSVLAQTYARYPVELVSGQGAVCEDGTGKQFIDMTSGIGVNALGFCDPGWVRAVSDQMTKIQHACNLFYTRPMVELAEALTNRTHFKRVFFGNSGAEANEGVIKAARKYGFDNYGKERTTIITLENSFHGRTITTLAATGQDVFHNYFFPFTEGFKFVPANDLDAMLSAMDETVCAVMIELVQGEGGVVPLEQDYVAALSTECAKRDILLIVDEVQTGIGRTGTLFSYEQFGIEPDIISSAKGLGAGLPIGAVLLGEKVQDTLGAGLHGTTFGGNPMACAGAVYVLECMDEAFLEDVIKKGEHTRKRLLGMPHVQNVSGLGLMIGITLDIDVKPIVAECIHRGLLVLTAKQKLRLLPPLNIDQAVLEEGLNRLEEALKGATL